MRSRMRNYVKHLNICISPELDEPKKKKWNAKGNKKNCFQSMDKRHTTFTHRTAKLNEMDKWIC